ncbi:chondroitin proteoglycan 2-like, partial [Antedon mediterranea]|uniref:chondroitin proteoglycan 2-like n=1 Tax=Antedon mediterranea TaxID=105859 RepID=UPI003AF8AF4D
NALGLCDQRSDDNYAHPANCSGYVACSSGRGIIQPCPNGLAYDEISNQCLQPENVPDCANISSTPADDPDDVCDLRTDGNYAHPTNCSVYVVCSSGRSIIQPCPNGLAYDETSNQCLQPENVPDCANISSTPADDPDDVCDLRSDGNYAHPTNCSVYVACSNGRSIIQPCPNGLAYDETSNQCLQPENVPDCANISSTPADDPDDLCDPRSDGQSDCFTDPDDVCNQRSDGNYAHPTNCSVYVACVNGGSTVQPCPSGLAYDETSDQCLQPENVPDCANISSTPADVTEGSPITSDTALTKQRKVQRPNGSTPSSDSSAELPVYILVVIIILVIIILVIILSVFCYRRSQKNNRVPVVNDTAIKITNRGDMSCPAKIINKSAEAEYETSIPTLCNNEHSNYDDVELHTYITLQ